MMTYTQIKQRVQDNFELHEWAALSDALEIGRDVYASTQVVDAKYRWLADELQEMYARGSSLDLEKTKMLQLYYRGFIRGIKRATGHYN